ncbi:MAG: hypothetical protein ABI472_12515 [Ginsengibacter sp.]
MLSNNAENRRNRHRKHSKYTKEKRKYLLSIVKWLKGNPTKFIAILCGGIIIYLAILFFIANREPGKEMIQINDQV